MTYEDLVFDEVEVFEFLDGLRESGITNMFGATPYIQEVFNLDKKQAGELLSKWMTTFSERHPQPAMCEAGVVIWQVNDE